MTLSPKKLCLPRIIILLLTVTQCAALIQEAKDTTYTVPALDCRKPHKVITGLAKQVCGSDQNQSVFRRKKAALILQRVDTQVVKAVRCAKWVTSLKEICGAFSHSKLFEPLSVEIPADFSETECKTVALRKIYTKEDGTSVPIELNQRVHYKHVKHGRTFLSDSNARCEGATVEINGEQHSSIVELVSTTILLQQVELEVTPTQVVDLDRHVRLESTCRNIPTCKDGMISYFIEPLDQCPYRLVRSLPFKTYTILEGNEARTAYISEEHRLLLVDRGMSTVGDRCKSKIPHVITRTQYENLYLAIQIPYGTDVKETAQKLTASDLDVGLELQVSLDYFSWKSEQQVATGIQKVGSSLCQVNQHTLRNAERSPFHPNSLLRARGAVIQELQCTPVEVTVQLGEKRSDKCPLNSVPAWMDNDPVYITTDSGLVLEPVDVSWVPCTSMMSTMVQATDGTFLTAQPEVQPVEVTLSHLDSDFLHLDDSGSTHPEMGQDLLYTKTEMEAFNALLHFSRIRSHVVDSLVQSYCTTADCGSYIPSEKGEFSLDNLKHEIVDGAFWWNEILPDLEKAGSYCSLAIIMYLVLMLLGRVLNIVRLRCRRNLTWKEAGRLNFFLATQLGETLLPNHTEEREREGGQVAGVLPEVGADGDQVAGGMEHMEMQRL